MAESRSAFQVRVRKEAGARKREVRKERDAEVRAITSDWKEGFANLKEENDRLQLEANEIYRESILEDDAWLREQLAAGPPAGEPKTIWKEEVMRNYARATRDNRTGREHLIEECTKKWKEGFRALKAENDRRQKAVGLFMKEQTAEVDAWLKEQLATGPP